MARLRKTETSVTLSAAAAAPVRRKAVATPRKRTAAASKSTEKNAAVEETAGEMTPLPEEIAALAYSYWVQRGYADGSQEQDWLRAEAELRERGPVTA
jgi:hypothetical protein